MDNSSDNRAERQNRVRIATELLPALGLGPHARSRSERNLASESGNPGVSGSGPEGSAKKYRTDPEAWTIDPDVLGTVAWYDETAPFHEAAYEAIAEWHSPSPADRPLSPPIANAHSGANEA